MDHLNKQQVILLALLVAIVTSITTGIVTVSLSDQSSESVTQTIYKVIEKTIDKVTPTDSPVRKIVEPSIPKPPAEVPLTDIVDKTAKGLVRIYRKTAGIDKPEFLTLGIFVGTKNSILALDTAIPIPLETSDLMATFPDGKQISISVKKVGIPSGLILLAPKDSKDIQTITPINLTDFSSLKLGSNIIALGGKEESNIVSTGIISEFANQDPNATSTSKDVGITDISLSSKLAGWILLDTSGNVIGFNMPSSEGEKTAKFLNSAIVKKSISSDI